MTRVKTIALLFYSYAILFIANPSIAHAQPADPTLSAMDIVRQCDNKNPGKDQVTQLTVTIKNKYGKSRKTVYYRFWKNFFDTEQQLDKMTLFTIAPPEVKNTAFMRYAYAPDAHRNADQWVYLPKLKKLRRVSIRDLGDRFLGSDLTYGDISLRLPRHDKHTLLGSKKSGANRLYLIESTPNESGSIYSRKQAQYEMSKDNCLKRHISYYDRKGALLKTQSIDWQQIGNAWLWKTVEIKNAQTFGSSIFEVSKAKVNVGVSEKWFTERMLKRGL